MLTLISIILCLTQIVLRKKTNLLTLCKVSIFLPLVFVFIYSMNSLSQAFSSIAHANDLPGSMLYEGLAALINSINVSLLCTLILAIVYAVSKMIYINQKDII